MMARNMPYRATLRALTTRTGSRLPAMMPSAVPTSTLGAASQPGQELFGIEATNGGLVIFGGGELLIRDNVIVGAIGVSGGSVAEDNNVAKAGAAALK